MKRSGLMTLASAAAMLAVLMSIGSLGLYACIFGDGATPLATPLGSSFPSSTAHYLGYIPKGYSTSPLLSSGVAPLVSSIQKFPCPSNFNSTQCTQFRASCGNGVCDPDETCSSCPIDCPVPQGLVCNADTGRAGSPVEVCDVVIPYFENTTANTSPSAVP